ncbi:MAG: twin-arginine translocation pathway signal protein [Leptothrix sp. (in: Bacteria)]|nr:twin-arginine translocation pathway signal protein [Leptothrix sp. (in: b-proteobacteria)]
MHRRAFVKVVGGGVIVGDGLAGCSAHMPAAAVRAWTDAGRDGDLRRWVLGYALLAPHSHNLQSWLVDLSRPDEIELRCDLTRLLPETDPLSRQIMMSQGTFIELLDIAARQRGQRAEITLFPQGVFAQDKPDGRPVAHIRLVADPAVPQDPLFAQITRRHTNRNAYALTRPVPAEAWQAMANAARAKSLRFGWVGADQPSELARHRLIAAEGWRIELQTPRTFLESLKVMRVGAAEVAEHRDGLTLLDPMVVWMSRLGLFDRSRAPAPDSFAITGQIKDFGVKLESTPGFLWMVSTGNDRVTQINAGRAYARVQLAATAHGVAMQPLQQALQEYPEVARPYADIHQLLQAPQPAQTVQMWARVGFAAPVGPAPRRGLDTHIIKA